MSLTELTGENRDLPSLLACLTPFMLFMSWSYVTT